MSDFTLTHYDAMRTAIVQAHSIDEVKDIRDKAEALRQYAKQAGESLDSQNRIAEIKLRAERRAGELIAEMPKAKGSDYGGKPAIAGNRVLPSNPPPTLSDLGISKIESSRFQAIASVPEPIFDAHITETKAKKNAELTSASMLKVAQEIKRDQKYAAMQSPSYWPTDQYRVIYADPPWPYERNEVGVTTAGGRVFGKAECHYPTLSIEELCAKGGDVQAMAHKDAVLFLWATVPLLPEALTVMAAWGFTYKTNYVWNKVRHNVGYYSSVRHEMLMLGVRGSCVPEGEKPNSVQTIERTSKHSQKPAEFRHLIDTLYPYGPRIELFARGELPEQWQGWGNEGAA
jgi:N6-adenosine-specific RNA methylase IME4